FLHQVFSHAIILSDDFSHALSNHATLDEKYKTLALKLLNDIPYPLDRYGRHRDLEINDIMLKINSLFQLDEGTDEWYLFGGTALTLMELYDFNEQQFIGLWKNQSKIKHPIKRKNNSKIH
ncbi:MAG: hypothetical protein QM666_11530, partial [Acinetobacter sp.]